MSAKTVDQQDYCCDDRDADMIPVFRQPFRRSAVQSFDLDAAFRRRFQLYDDDDEEKEDWDHVLSPRCSEYSDDYLSMTGSGTSTTTLPPGFLEDRLASLSVSSGDSFYLDDPEVDDDRCSISTLENVDDGPHHDRGVQQWLKLMKKNN